jgi:hypothetical protein
MNLLTTVSPAFMLVAGFVVCFFGYRLLRLTLGLAGFGVGLALGLFLAAMLAPSASQILTIVIGIVCGILGALAATLLYKLGVFLLGAAAGALAAGVLVIATGWHYPLLIRIAGAIIGGILTLVLERPLVSILSALAGAWGIVLGAFRILGWYRSAAGTGKPPANYGIMVACWLVLALVGAGVQLRSGRGRKEKPRPAGRPS